MEPKLVIHLNSIFIILYLISYIYLKMYDSNCKQYISCLISLALYNHCFRDVDNLTASL